MATVGFLHTAGVHVDTFERLVAERRATVSTVHVVRPELLEAARRDGIGAAHVANLMGAALDELERHAAEAIVCTCSTVSGIAERPALNGRPPVLRVDRPMAARAVSSGSRIAVVAALESTIEPTLALLGEEAAAADRIVDVRSVPCFDAWPLFERGDTDGYVQRIAAHVDALDADFDVVVLAQVSMRDAEQLVQPGRRVLSSPAAAVKALLSCVVTP